MDENREFKIKTQLQRKSDMKTFDLTFRTLPGLFSFRRIDDGTQLLMNELDLKDDHNCLDLGCGYGAIGIAMAKLAPKGRTTMVDRDFIAVEYANINIKENNVRNAEALLSNGLSHIGKMKFDVIVSNLPTHTGKLAMHNIIDGMKTHLNENGRVYVVTMSFIRHFIKSEFMMAFGNYEKLKQGKKHAVSYAIKKSIQ